MKRWLQFAAGITVVLVSTSAFADSAEVATRSAGWTWSAYITIPLFAIALLYVAGLLRMWRRGAQLRWLPTLCFAAGWVSLFLALNSPVHEVSEQLFWVHMTQHEILMLISAPLLILSQPAAPILFALPERWRVPVANVSKMKIIEGTWLLVSAPVAAWLLHAAALWVWHAPKLFDAAVESEWVHAAQHISFLGTALLFWWTLFHKHPVRLHDRRPHQRLGRTAHLRPARMVCALRPNCTAMGLDRTSGPANRRTHHVGSSRHPADDCRSRAARQMDEPLR
jgi:cytochrome c oxidase assembly factor CtaG